MNSKPDGHGWSLEIVRGRDAGKVYALGSGEIVLGNSLGGSNGIDLADQEGNAPRKMAAKQALLNCSGQAVSLRDLDSPGGTFVNRQRVLPGQARALQHGDLIQLGGVQLRVVGNSTPSPAPQPTAPAPSRAQPPPTPRPAPPPPTPRATAPPAPRPQAPPQPVSTAPFLYTLKAGPVCRSWDDFLTISAQRWSDLREELTSGRLATFAASIGRPSLAPAANAAGTADERLDAWLGSLPTTRTSTPELEVHPEKVAIRAVAGGGLTRRKLHVTNTGYRLLRATARVEPADSPWLAIAPEFVGKAFVTIEGTDLPIEILIPDPVTEPISAAVVVESNGGTRRVVVTVEPPSARDQIPEAGPAVGARAEWGLGDAIAGQPVPLRVATWAVSGFLARLLVAGGEKITPDLLRGPAILFAIVGGLAGAFLAGRRGSTRDVPAGGFAGAFAGVLAAALIFAACRTIEPVWGGQTVVGLVVWTALGAGLAFLSAILVPARPRTEVSP